MERNDSAEEQNNDQWARREVPLENEFEWTGNENNGRLVEAMIIK